MTVSTEPQVVARAASKPVGLGDYALVSVMLALFGSGLGFATRGAERSVATAQLVPPIVALVVLTGIVWLLMVVFRVYASLRGISSASYYSDYRSDPPPDWVERPARTFNNLFQTPLLFYVASALAISTGHVDQAQVQLAWIFVAARLVHAVIYIGWNHVPYRFAAWVAGCITLGVIWFRLAVRIWP